MAPLSDDSIHAPGSAETQPWQTADGDMGRALAVCAIELMHASAPEALIPNVLARLGRAAGVSRIQAYEGATGLAASSTLALRYEWHSPKCTPAVQVLGIGARPLPGKGDTLALLTRQTIGPQQDSLSAMGIQSLLLTPVHVGGERWGEVEFADCDRERIWSAGEIDTLKLLAEMIGAALGRARDLQEFPDVSWIIENSPVILYRVDGKPPHRLTYISRGVRRYGYEARELMASPGLYFDLLHPDDLLVMKADIDAFVAGRTREMQREHRLRAADGHLVWFENRSRGHYGPQNELLEIEGLLVDISERKTAQAELAQVSFFDPVTGLPNRRAFMAELDRAYAAARRGGPAFAIHYIDLDRFKDINDVLGHTKGDELLKAVAERLRRLRRKNADVLARFGGDEFAILQVEIASPADAGAFAARLIERIAEPYNLGVEIHITCSIGIAVFTEEVTGTEEMMKQVDLALYRAKDLGRNQFHFHSEALDAATIERVMLGGDLQRAVERGELNLEFQPQVEIATGRIVGLEALARWTHPKYGSIGPTRFVPIAESNGTILALGRWVIDAVCRQIVEWRAAGLKPPPVSFNVSVGQLKGASEFDRELASRLRRWGIEPKAVEIELTESVLMETTQRHRDIIDRMCALGVPIAIDDFGTGYSSLTYLRSYRVDHIKVAQDFIRDIKPGSGDIAVVRAAISLGRELGIAVVAEGVESEFQLNLVKEAGCQFVQGYYYSPPLPPARVSELLRQGVLAPGAGVSPQGGAAKREDATSPAGRPRS
ncbi:MAG TPA: EAL domain-containing protein [Pseudolabrys sp.]|nr:EAL domain-containing protein [Pseudolabrys sp.]